MKILYVGPLFEGSTCLQRMAALSHLGYEVLPVNTCPPEVARQEKRPWERIWRRLMGPRDLARANAQILRLARQEQPRVLWVDKGLAIRPHTLARAKSLAPGLVRVSYSPDDMMNPGNQSRRYLASVPTYDLHVTTKSYNVPELEALGAPRVLFIDNAYCPFSHRPLELANIVKAQWGGQVGFIGTFEEERALALLFLARQGIPVKVWGNWPISWHRRHLYLRIMGRAIYADDYAHAINSFAINLAFLRKSNRDLQTTRSVEIPACGGFMLAERTPEHQHLFEEGHEADFFDSREEMLQKIQYYIANPELRRTIAAAGRRRCLEGGYSNVERLRSILEQISPLLNPV